MVELKLPTVEKFLNYIPLDIGGYVIGAINLLANIFASILQLRTTISANLKEFHGSTDENPCKSASFYGYNELMSSNTVLSAFISFYLLNGVITRNSVQIIPFLVYLGVYTFTSFLHMMSVHEGNVAFGFTMATFHGYSFIVIYSILMEVLAGKTEEEPEEVKDEEAGLTEGDEKVKGEEDEEFAYIA